jgi:hypothetical protein
MPQPYITSHLKNFGGLTIVAYYVDTTPKIILDSIKEAFLLIVELFSSLGEEIRLPTSQAFSQRQM